MLSQTILTGLLASLATAALTVETSAVRTFSTYNPSASQIAEDAKNAPEPATYSSNVKGNFFDRMVIIWLENTDFDKAKDNTDFEWLANQGIALENYWAVTHPSQPNYVAAVGGDYFALPGDDFVTIPANVSNIADLLDSKGISWGEYQEHMPYTGFQGYELNDEDGAHDYMRKHSPLISYENVATNTTRLGHIKNFTLFEEDLANEALPQWMFITPNMTNDGHDSNINIASNWLRNFLTPLLKNDYFMNNTLILVSFDENESYPDKNIVYSLLLGGVIPEDKKGTIDTTFYDHYSEISTVEANWDLDNLGRLDATANVFELVANASNITNVDVDTEYKTNNLTYVGYFNDDSIPFPAPNVTLKGMNGKPVLDSIVSVWAKEYSAQVSDGYFTSTTTTVTGSIPVATSSYNDSLITSLKNPPPTKSSSASASGSDSASKSKSSDSASDSASKSKSSDSASASATKSSSSSDSKSKNGAGALELSFSAGVVGLLSFLL